MNNKLHIWVVYRRVMGFFKTEMYDYEGFIGIEGCACASCGVKSHSPFTWILCRIGQIDSYCYFTFDSYNWLTNKWWDFQERFKKCSFCSHRNLFRDRGYHSYGGLEEELGNRYGKSWCQHCWNERVGEGGCGYQS